MRQTGDAHSGSVQPSQTSRAGQKEMGYALPLHTEPLIPTLHRQANVHEMHKPYGSHSNRSYTAPLQPAANHKSNCNYRRNCNYASYRMQTPISCGDRQRLRDFSRQSTASATHRLRHIRPAALAQLVPRISINAYNPSAIKRPLTNCLTHFVTYSASPGLMSVSVLTSFGLPPPLVALASHPRPPSTSPSAFA